MISMAFMKQVTGKIENVLFVLGDKFVTGLLYYFHMSSCHKTILGRNDIQLYI